MNRRPHITHIIDGLGTGGAERIVYELATRTSPDKFLVDVIGLAPRAGDATKHALEVAGIKVCWIEKNDKLGIELYEDLVQEFQQTHPDIVHTHLFAADVWGTQAASRAHVPIVISTEHSVNQNEGFLKNLLKKRARKHQTQIIAVSEAVAAYVKEQSPAQEDKVQVIANGIDVERFVKAGDVVRESHKPVELVVVGRLDPEKGQASLLRALAYVSDDFRLTFVGDGSQRLGLEDQVKKLGWQHKVKFVGRRDDVEKFYQAADIAIVPSRWEGLGLAALEAMAAGCAVVAADVDGLREIVRHGETGLLVNFEAAKLAGEAISELMRDPKRQRALAGLGLEMVRREYTVDVMVAEYEKLYQSFL
ncbi:MAG: hypothetical protein COW24_03820 [Candidatus Kerfeldbacteria bacterium CG15_BIG_FIL_POST_REV_8_21_14_020_45_12]|uniref:Glycosyltransferase n=1 Tax=Candidatus Kerfeldbacteria bacterium CG15_BIG_FIL_POST_REV_8_21_14_020_45_12 TaxID=2014247 RepID=A0A2M7H3I3_9BACT|nr:MAG: hypothetical protein COW24_03820 [Candidatus Kerfeldbacteria bacterium CG15_BIG_FIL_POST_REV_8_21_14_020_45_12]